MHVVQVPKKHAGKLQDSSWKFKILVSSASRRIGFVKLIYNGGSSYYANYHTGMLLPTLASGRHKVSWNYSIRIISDFPASESLVISIHKAESSPFPPFQVVAVSALLKSSKGSNSKQKLHYIRILIALSYFTKVTFNIYLFWITTSWKHRKNFIVQLRNLSRNNALNSDIQLDRLSNYSTYFHF